MIHSFWNREEQGALWENALVHTFHKDVGFSVGHPRFLESTTWGQLPTGASFSSDYNFNTLFSNIGKRPILCALVGTIDWDSISIHHHDEDGTNGSGDTSIRFIRFTLSAPPQKEDQIKFYDGIRNLHILENTLESPADDQHPFYALRDKKRLTLYFRLTHQTQPTLNLVHAATEYKFLNRFFGIKLYGLAQLKVAKYKLMDNVEAFKAELDSPPDKAQFRLKIEENGGIINLEDFADRGEDMVAHIGFLISNSHNGCMTAGFLEGYIM